MSFELYQIDICLIVRFFKLPKDHALIILEMSQDDVHKTKFSLKIVWMTHIFLAQET